MCKILAHGCKIGNTARNGKYNDKKRGWATNSVILQKVLQKPWVPPVSLKHVSFISIPIYKIKGTKLPQNEQILKSLQFKIHFILTHIVFQNTNGSARYFSFYNIIEKKVKSLINVDVTTQKIGMLCAQICEQMVFCIKVALWAWIYVYHPFNRVVVVQ